MDSRRCRSRNAAQQRVRTGVTVPTSLNEFARMLDPHRPERLEIEKLNDRLERTTRQLKSAREEVAALSARVVPSAVSEPITGLPNRSACLDAVDRTLKLLRHGPGRRVAILSVGFEKLQRVADVFGYPVLDRLLLEAARRIELVLGPSDTVFRTGETRLAIIIGDAGDSARTMALGNSLGEALRQACQVDGGRFYLDPHIGIVCVAGGYECADQVLGRAVLAMYRAGESGNHGVALFQERSADDVAQRLMLEADVRRALELNEFVLWYQPVFDTVSNTVAGFEALLRWNHPRDGLREPASFLPVANEIGLMSGITRWVLREAASQSAVWSRGGRDGLFISANLTAESFSEPNLVGEIADLLMEFQLPAGKLKLEIVESTVVANVTRTAKLISTLKDLGVPVWLDDFGTGYSSLSYLRALAFQGVKLDASFVARMVVDSRDFGLVKSIIDLLQYLEMSCVAEGVETRDQRELLALAGCELCQGFVFAHPMPAAEAHRYLAFPPAAAHQQAKR
jgi:diguanylate cyclase (GGDEF)-like protein